MESLLKTLIDSCSVGPLYSTLGQNPQQALFREMKDLSQIWAASLSESSDPARNGIDREKLFQEWHTLGNHLPYDQIGPAFKGRYRYPVIDSYWETLGKNKSLILSPLTFDPKTVLDKSLLKGTVASRHRVVKKINEQEAVLVGIHSLLGIDNKSLPSFSMERVISNIGLFSHFDGVKFLADGGAELGIKRFFGLSSFGLFIEKVILTAVIAVNYGGNTWESSEAELVFQRNLSDPVHPEIKLSQFKTIDNKGNIKKSCLEETLGLFVIANRLLSYWLKYFKGENS